MNLSRRQFLGLGLVEAAAFSRLQRGGALPGWQPYVFPRASRRTEYTLVEDEGRVVLRARADASMSGLVREQRVDLRQYPVLAWRWKVMSLPANADLSTRAGDDFAARLYLLFDLPDEALSAVDRVKLAMARAVWDARLPNATLCYVWDVRAPVGTIAPSAYTDRVRMVVADTGPALLGKWVERERNVAADFRAAFGIEAPPVSAIVLAADTDNTGASTEAYFGDAAFRAASP